MPATYRIHSRNGMHDVYETSTNTLVGTYGHRDDALRAIRQLQDGTL